MKCVHEEDETSTPTSGAAAVAASSPHPSFAYRDFELTRDGETRAVAQMAYLSWPDHGVPDSPDQFVAFVEKVRSLRQVREKEIYFGNK